MTTRKKKKFPKAQGLDCFKFVALTTLSELEYTQRIFTQEVGSKRKEFKVTKELKEDHYG